MKEPSKAVALKNLTKEEEEFRALAAESNLLSDEEFSSRKIIPSQETLKQDIQTAQLMCKAKSMLPDHLHGNPGECLAMVLLARDWNMNPYHVGAGTYIAKSGSKIGFTGQLVNAVINNSRRLVMPLKYRYEGEDKDRICYAYGRLYYYDFEDHQLKKEDEDREVKVTMPKNIAKKGTKGTYYVDKAMSSLWESDPDQQLAYKAARWFARKFIPEILLGVYTPQEITEMGQQHKPARDSSDTPATNIDNIIKQHREEKEDLPIKEAELVDDKKVLDHEEKQGDGEAQPEVSESEQDTATDSSPDASECPNCQGRGVVDGVDIDSGELFKEPCPECKQS